MGHAGLRWLRAECKSVFDNTRPGSVGLGAAAQHTAPQGRIQRCLADLLREMASRFHLLDARVARAIATARYRRSSLTDRLRRFEGVEGEVDVALLGASQWRAAGSTRA